MHIRFGFRFSRALAIVAMACSFASCVVPKKAVELFGQKTPGVAPERFAQARFEKVSPFVETCAVSPDGTICLIGVGNSNYTASTMSISRKTGDTWTAFESVPFAAEFEYTGEPVFSRDGGSLVFTGKRKDDPSTDFFRVSISDGKFGIPAALPAPINGPASEFRPCFMPDGSLYFVSARDEGMNQLFKAIPGADGSWTVEKLPPQINTNNWECDPCLPSDGRFMVYFSGMGGKSTDPFVVFPDGKGGWGTPIPIPGLGTSRDEYGASLTPDESAMFFTRHSKSGNEIWWISVEAIDGLRK